MQEEAMFDREKRCNSLTFMVEFYALQMKW